VLQAQLFYFLSQACVLGVNHLIVDYMWYGSNKGHFEPQPAAMGGVWRLFRNPSQSAAVGVVVPDHSAGRDEANVGGCLNESSAISEDGPLKQFSDEHKCSSGRSSYFVSSIFPLSPGRSSLPSTGIERMVGPPLVHFNLNGHDSENRRIVKMAATQSKNGDGTGERGLSVSSSAGGGEPFLPMVLTTLHYAGGSDGDGIRHGTTPANDFELDSNLLPRVRGTAVMGIGGGVVVNLDSDDMDNKEMGVLSKGSHAFVRCYGEKHLRCT